MGLLPRLLPGLALLGLLGLKPNRGWAAWWIWLPVVCLAAGCPYLARAWEGHSAALPGEALEVFLQVPVALAFGLAAVWLLASYLGDHSRFRACLGFLTVFAVFILFSFVASVGWGLAVEPVGSILDPRHCAATASVGLLALPPLVLVALFAPVVAAAMVLSGLACRGRYRPLGQWLWLLLSLLAGWVAVSALFYGLCPVAMPGSEGYAPFLGLGLLMLVVTFATLLPFLALSAVSAWFRERLTALLHLTPAAPSAVSAPASLAADPPGH